MNKKNILLFLIILLLGVFFRIYKFNQIPASLNWDEVAIGWNAAAIWEAKIDQYGTRWPLSFKSYGDFKAPFLIYATAPFIGLLGLKDWVVRLPILIVSILSIPLVYLLSIQILEYFSFNSKKIQLISFLNMFYFAISPWHIRFSRGAFEATLALFFIILATYLFFLSLRKYYLSIFSGIFFIFSLYSYHSPKLFIPLFLILLLLVFKTELFIKIKKNLVLSILFLFILIGLSLPLIKENLFNGGSERSGTLIIFENNNIVKLDFNLLNQIFSNLIKHISPNFFIYGQNNNFRNNLKNIGIMSSVQYLFFLIGLFILIFNKKINKSFKLFIFLWILIGLLPGILSKPDSVPHTIRTLNSIYSILLISAIGLIYFIEFIKTKYITIFENKINLFVSALILISFLFLKSLIYFYQEYFIKFPFYSALDWQFGYKEASQISKEFESKVDKIILTSQYQHPYLFFSFYEQRNPLYVIWGEMSKYQFQDKISWDGDKFCKNCLLIGTNLEIPNDIPEDIGKIIEEIKFPNGHIAFRIVKTN